MKKINFVTHLRSFLLSIFLVGIIYFITQVIISIRFEPETDPTVQSEYAIGSTIDTIKGNNLDNQTESIQLSDKKVILHFWASWCSPCVTEMPELIDFVIKNKDVLVIAVSQDSDIKELNSFMKSFPEMRTQFINFHDQNRNIAKQFNINKLPETVVLHHGNYVKKISGSMPWHQIKSFDQLVDK